MSFSRVKPAGWTHPDPITAAQLNALDTDHANAVDGMGGGEYAPSADIKFPGANSIEWGDTRWPKVTSRDVVRMQPLSIAGMSAFSAPDWFISTAATPTMGGLTQNYVDVSGTNDPIVLIPIPNLVDLSTLTAITLRVKPTSATPPAEPPKVRLYKQTFNGSQAVGGEVTDPVTGTDYGNEHDVAIALSEAIDQADNESYFLRFVGESGSGATSGFQIRFIRAHFTATLLVPG